MQTAGRPALVAQSAAVEYERHRPEQTTLYRLVQQHATGVYERKPAALSRVGLLIIDDFGLKPLRAPADEDLHDLIAERYERSATIVTSNLDFDEWDQAFAANRLLASATLDRLRHNAYCLELDGPSYRDPKVAPAAENGLAKTARKGPQKAAETTAK